MYILDDISFSYLFLLIPLLVLIFILVVSWKIKTQKRIISKKMLNILIPYRSNFKIIFKFTLLIISIISVIIALINPKIGKELEIVKR